MNKKFTYKTIIFLMICGLSFQSCEDFLDEESLTDVSLDFVYTTEEGLNSALVGLYHLNRLHHNNTSSNSFRTLVMPVKSDLAVVRTGAPVLTTARSDLTGITNVLNELLDVLL